MTQDTLIMLERSGITDWISLIAVIAAAVAAMAAWRVVAQARKALQAQLVVNISAAYRAPEMLNERSSDISRKVLQ